MSLFERHVSHRCAHQREHHTTTGLVTCKHDSSPHRMNADDIFCVNPRPIPRLEIPCPECYSVESFWRRIPWEPDSRTEVEMEIP